MITVFVIVYKLYLYRLTENNLGQTQLLSTEALARQLEITLESLQYAKLQPAITMNVVTKRFTLEEYLSYNDNTDTQYELVAGELVAIPPESPQNSMIARYLLAEFLKFVPIQRLCYKDTEIVVSGSRATTRLPDLMVLTEELVEAIQDASRGTITLDMPPPALVVEVVSPGKVNEDRHYRYKRSEYAARGVSEYWIVDPFSKTPTQKE